MKGLEVLGEALTSVLDECTKGRIRGRRQLFVLLENRVTISTGMLIVTPGGCFLGRHSYYQHQETGLRKVTAVHSMAGPQEHPDFEVVSEWRKCGPLSCFPSVGVAANPFRRHADPANTHARVRTASGEKNDRHRDVTANQRTSSSDRDTSLPTRGC